MVLKLMSMLLLIHLIGCSQMGSNRSFLSEMQNDDSSFYRPNQDFPVVAGDAGEMNETDAERRSRTPASPEDMAQERSRLSLLEELRRLEEAQSESSMFLYQKYRHRFATTSEKIFYLKLPPSERLSYIESRGFVEAVSEVQESLPSTKKLFGVRKQDIFIGMSKEDVLSSFGRPLSQEVAGNPVYENERWAYNLNGATKYIYFEGGRVEGWE